MTKKDLAERDSHALARQDGLLSNKAIRLIPALGLLLLFGFVAIPSSEPTVQAAEREKPGKVLAGWLKKRGYVEVPLILNKADWLDVKVEVEGLTMLFMLDTGANNINMHRPSAQRAKLPIKEIEDKTAAFGGTLTTGQTKIAKLSVGGLTSPGESYVVDFAPTNTARKGYGEPPIDGVLGGGFLVHRSAIIDYSHTKLYLLPPDRKPISPATLLKRDSYVEVPLELNKLAILDVEVEADGAPILFFVDTGARGIVSLDRSSAKRAKLAVQQNKARSNELGGTIITGSAKIQQLWVGRYVSAADVHVTDFSTTNALRRANHIPRCDGTLDGGFLKERSAIIDYANRKLYLFDPDRD
jgi:predicted aspartyl protease